jgi:hypothetical protein
LKTDIHLIVNGKKRPFSNYIDINEIKEFNLDENELEKKDYINV